MRKLKKIFVFSNIIYFIVEILQSFQEYLNYKSNELNKDIAKNV